MSACTFFGHRDCPAAVRPLLQKTLIDLIETHSVNMFYVGNQGAFDRIVRSVLRELQSIYPHIRYAVVLAYMPGKRDADYPEDVTDTMLPEGIESVPKRLAISWRNKWMLQRSDFVVTYVTASWGGAAQFAEMARRQGKHVFNLASESD